MRKKPFFNSSKKAKEEEKFIEISEKKTKLFKRFRNKGTF